MVLTSKQLRRIIKEEVAAALNEDFLSKGESDPENIKAEMNKLAGLLDDPRAKPKMMMQMKALMNLFARTLKSASSEK